MSILLIVYVIVHVLIHFALTAQKCMSEPNQVKDIDNNDAEDAPGAVFRKAIAFFYIGFVYTVSIALIIWIATLM